MRKIVVLDGYTANPGDLSWKPFEEFGTMSVCKSLNYRIIFPVKSVSISDISASFII